MNEQDAHLMKARELVPSVLDEIMNFKVRLKTPLQEPAKVTLHTIQEDKTECVSISGKDNSSEERLYSEVLNSPTTKFSTTGNSSDAALVNFSLFSSDNSLDDIIASQKEALLQVTELLEKLEKVEKLYPTLKALGNDYEVYSSQSFQNKLNTLCLWSNITKDIGNKLSLMATVLYVENIPGLNWPWFDDESPAQILNQIRDTSETITPTVTIKHGDGLSSEEEDNIFTDDLNDKNIKLQITQQSYNDGLSSSSDESETDEVLGNVQSDPNDNLHQSFNDGLSSSDDEAESNDAGVKIHDGLSSSDSGSEDTKQTGDQVVSNYLASNDTANCDSTPKCNKNVRFSGLDLNSPDTSPVESAVNLLACTPPDSSTPRKPQHFPNRQISNTSTLSRTSSSLSYEDSRTSIYRHFVDRHLKKMGLRKLLHRLKCLLDGSLQRARHALEKPKGIGKSESLDMLITEVSIL